MAYNYKEAVMNDVKDYINNNIDLSEWKGRRTDLEDKLNDELFTEDSVTGNGSGSYTCNSWQAEENLSHNWHLIEECSIDFGIAPVISTEWYHGAEWWDVSIRCHLLREAISEVLDELDEELEGE
jgi:hypothetical protein